VSGLNVNADAAPTVHGHPIQRSKPKIRLNGRGNAKLSHQMCGSTHRLCFGHMLIDLKYRSRPSAKDNGLRHVHIAGFDGQLERVYEIENVLFLVLVPPRGIVLVTLLCVSKQLHHISIASCFFRPFGRRRRKGWDAFERGPFLGPHSCSLLFPPPTRIRTSLSPFATTTHGFLLLLADPVVWCIGLLRAVLTCGADMRC
jgi:hypothetical protein